MATRSRARGNGRQGRPAQTRARHDDQSGIIPVLARAVREVEGAVQRGRITQQDRTKFHVVALLAREERARVRGDSTLTDARRDTELKRLEGIAAILAQIAAAHPTFFELLTEDAEVTSSVRELKHEMQRKAGIEVHLEEPEEGEEGEDGERRPVPQSVLRRQLASPFMAPDLSTPTPRPQSHLLAGWELIEPLLNAFEHPTPGAPSCMELPDPTDVGLDPIDQRLGLIRSNGSGPSLALMPHQSKVVAATADGHRTFLLADEPGLGKTAQALLAAQVADAFPLLCVVPNVVKTNWAREVQRWVPRRTASVVHGDGGDLDAFADVVIVNYEVLDRHVEWMGDFGFRGMVVDEAHFIKNKKSQRSQHVREIADRIRVRAPRPLMMALTGTPLINDIEDFRAIWEFLGWVDEKKPRRELLAKLEDNGCTPADHAFYPRARQTVIDMGIVRRRKSEVAADIPARRVADMPVELEGAVGRSVREAERKLAERMLERYDAALRTRVASGKAEIVDGIDPEVVRRVAKWELSEGGEENEGENIFAMVRRIGQAKAPLAADYAAQLARSAGKVVFFAKHIDVMDAAQEAFEAQGIKYASIRGEQTSTTRQANVDAFTNDRAVQVAVCSLTAAGVGLNLQVASDVVLAELSWTDAEQTQAIDRVHRIGQTEPVTAWRIIAAQTMDARIAELIDKKAGLAATALDGGEEAADTTDVQLEALVSLLSTALRARQPAFG